MVARCEELAGGDGVERGGVGVKKQTLKMGLCGLGIFFFCNRAEHEEGRVMKMMLMVMKKRKNKGKMF